MTNFLFLVWFFLFGSEEQVKDDEQESVNEDDEFLMALEEQESVNSVEEEGKKSGTWYV